jgi:hypothetical protein
VPQMDQDHIEQLLGPGVPVSLVTCGLAAHSAT